MTTRHDVRQLHATRFVEHFVGQNIRNHVVPSTIQISAPSLALVGGPRIRRKLAAVACGVCDITRTTSSGAHRARIVSTRRLCEVVNAVSDAVTLCRKSVTRNDDRYSSTLLRPRTKP